MTERITHAFNLLGLIFSKVGVHSRERFLLGSSVSTINISVGSSNQCKGCPVRALLRLRDETLTPQFNSIWRRAFECMLCRLIHEAMPTHISWKYCLESQLQHFWSSFHPMHPVRHWFQLSAWATAPEWNAGLLVSACPSPKCYRLLVSDPADGCRVEYLSQGVNKTYSLIERWGFWELVRFTWGHDNVALFVI